MPLIQNFFTLISDPKIGEDSFRILSNQLTNFNLCQLFGFIYAVEALKSVLIVLATVSRCLGVEEAVALSLLEQTYQTEKWGEVSCFLIFTVSSVLYKSWRA